MRDSWRQLFMVILLTVGLVSNPFVIAHAVEQDLYPFTSTQDARRFELLTQEIRCVVCQNQNIADSNAPLANDLREKVYRMVLDQKSNADIKDYLVKRYGDFILLSPPLTKQTAILWLFPLLGLGVVAIFSLRLKR